jgi:superfamily II DNA or RNA helicase
MRVHTSPSVAQEIADHFSFMSPNAKFDPRVKNKYWDGRIRLFNPMTGLIYCGLVSAISDFADTRNYTLEIGDDLINNEVNFNEYDFNLKIEPRPYQVDAYNAAITNERGIFLSPTSSGKSFIIHNILRYYNEEGHKALLIVPRVSLVLQMKSDFESYTSDELDMYCITAGVDKNTASDITITTWQSIYKMPRQWFEQFGVVVGDEVHEFEAKSLKSIMEKMVNTKYRFGFTGTLKDTQTNKMTLEGLFGPINEVITYKELMENNWIAKLKIRAIILKYEDQERKDSRKFTYHDEIKFLNEHDKRNKFIRNLALNFEKNSLILFNRIDHGKLLYDMISNKDETRDVYLIYGGVDAEDRETIRKLLDTKFNAILVASYGTFSTGVNVPNLHHVVLGSPYKSRVKILQSIGRGLRLHSEKDFLTVYDIADDLKYKTQSNFTLSHFSERANIYNQEGFGVRIITVDL